MMNLCWRFPNYCPKNLNRIMKEIKDKRVFFFYHANFDIKIKYTKTYIICDAFSNSIKRELVGIAFNFICHRI